MHVVHSFGFGWFYLSVSRMCHTVIHQNLMTNFLIQLISISVCGKSLQGSHVVTLVFSHYEVSFRWINMFRYLWYFVTLII